MPDAPLLSPELDMDLLQDDFFGRALHLVSRLRDHIQRLDEGVVYAVDDLAVILRAFIHPGRGNDVLRRLRSKSGVDPSRLLLSKPPETNGAGFAVGSIPVRHAGSTAHGASYVPVDEWPNTPVLRVVAGGTSKNYTWAEFLNTYANKWGGAHLDDAIPSHLQAIDYCAAGGLNLSSYLIRCAAVEVWFIAQRLLSEWLSIASNHELLNLDSSRLVAPGGIKEDPANMTHKGSLQWFWWNDAEADFLWYVDPTSHINALRLYIGGMSWDVQYDATNKMRPASASPIFQEPRKLSSISPSGPRVSTGSNVNVSGRVLAFPR